MELLWFWSQITWQNNKLKYDKIWIYTIFVDIIMSRLRVERILPIGKYLTKVQGCVSWYIELTVCSMDIAYMCMVFYCVCSILWLIALWPVGISALDLCLPNCTWSGDVHIDLYPWDSGTDDGITYMVPIVLASALFKLLFTLRVNDCVNAYVSYSHIAL